MEDIVMRSRDQEEEMEVVVDINQLYTKYETLKAQGLNSNSEEFSDARHNLSYETGCLDLLKLRKYNHPLLAFVTDICTAYRCQKIVGGSGVETIRVKFGAQGTLEYTHKLGRCTNRNPNSRSHLHSLEWSFGKTITNFIDDCSKQEPGIVGSTLTLQIHNIALQQVLANALSIPVQNCEILSLLNDIVAIGREFCKVHTKYIFAATPNQ